MNWIRTIFREIFGLFVDDGIFALLILVWLGLMVFVLPRMGWAAGVRGVVLFLGLAGILMGSAIRYAHRDGR